MKTLLIIPAYNEQDSLLNTIVEIRKNESNVDYLIINDGSNDNTVQICRKNQFPFIDLSTNLGLAGAFQTGMKYAYRHHYDCAIQFDADGQHRPEYVSVLLEPILNNKYDIVIGSRFLEKKKPFSLRMFGSYLIEAAIKITTGKTITDPTSGMRAFNKRMIKEMAKGLNLGPEPDTVSYLIKRANAKVEEVPVSMSKRTAGESYFSPWRSAIYMLRMSISILFIQLFRKPLNEGK